MDGVHFCESGQLEPAEIVVTPPGENGAFFDLCLMALTRLELNLPFKIDIPAAEQSHIDIGVKGPDRHPQFRMVSNDLIRGLPLKNKRGNDLVLFQQIMFCKVDAGPGGAEAFIVFAISNPGVIAIPAGNRAVHPCFVAAIAHIRSLLQTAAVFTLELGTGLVAGRTGCTFHTA